MTRVLALASGKGGAGKTSVSVNLAFALARGGRRVLILDADLGLSNVDVLLGLSPDKSLEHVLFENLPMRQAMLPVSPLVDVISGGSGVARLAELSRPARQRLAQEFAALSDYDYILVDNSPGVSSQVMALCLACNEIAVVVNPEAASVVDAYALVKLLRQNGLIRPPMLILNRVASEAQARAVFARFAATAVKHLGLPCVWLGFVPEDRAVAAAAARQTPLVVSHPASEAARAFLSLALALDTRVGTMVGNGVGNGAGHGAGNGSGTRPPDQHPAVFFDRAVMGVLERPGPQSGLAPDLEAEETARLALAGIEAALARLAGLETAGPEDQAQTLAAARQELAELRQSLARRGNRAGRAAVAIPAKPKARAARWMVCCPDPFRAELLREVAAEAGLDVAEADMAEENPAAPPQGILAWDPPDETAAALAGQWPEAAWVLVGDPRWPASLPGVRAVERVATPFQVETLLTAIGRVKKAAPSPKNPGTGS